MSEVTTEPTVPTELLEVTRVRATIGDGLLKVKEDRGATYLCVDPSALLTTVTTLKEDSDLAYDYFVECLGVDYSRWTHTRDLPGRFEVVYNLFSVSRATRVFVKTSVDDGQTVPTLKDIFLGAEFPEREIQDLFGVVFEGNTPMPGVRFILPDDWVGYPLRKEYPLGGEDVNFDLGSRGPAIEDVQMPHAGESFDGKTGSGNVSGR